MKVDKKATFWAKTLYLSITNDPENAKKIFENLERASGKRIIFLLAILKKFEKIYMREKRAELILARAMSEKDKEEIKKKMKKILVGMEKIDDVVDESLLAGFRLKMKDVLIKASLKDVLQKLKNKTYGHN